MVTPKFKLINELHYWDTDLTGKSESSLESFHLKGIYLTPGPQVGNVKSRFAVGVEWIKEVGDAKDGTSSGTDQVAPFTGFGWLLSKEATLITLVQHFSSYSEEHGVEDVSRTAPRVIYLHSFPSRNIKHQSLYEILNSETRKNFLDNHKLSQYCKNCAYLFQKD